MDWTEVTIYAKKEALEMLQSELMDIGVGAVVVEDPDELMEFIEETKDDWDMVDEQFELSLKDLKPNVKMYVTCGEDGDSLLGRITDLVDRLSSSGDPMYEDMQAEKLFVKDEDWEYNWKDFFKPIETGKKLYIKPVWDETASPEDRIDVLVDPGTSFGSGQHETTRMCLEAIEEYAPGAELFMDIGCGSGILSVAAAKLGAKRVIAVDIDENAVTATKDICRVNDVCERITIMKADLTEGIIDKADVIVANIFAGTIIRLLGNVKENLVEGGIFISTGIIADRLGEVIDAYRESGFDIIDVRSMGEWRLVIGRLS